MVVAVGATPVFVDIDPRTRNIDLGAAEAAITPRTRALMPVDLAGLPVTDGRAVRHRAQHGLRVIEDAAQAIGSRWAGGRIGSFGDLVSFSFQANKNITCVEGGCLVLSDDSRGRARRAAAPAGRRAQRRRRAWTSSARAASSTSPTSTRRIGLGQLDGLDAITRRRAELAARYFEAAATAGLERSASSCRSAVDRGRTTNWHMFQVAAAAERCAAARAA